MSILLVEIEFLLTVLEDQISELLGIKSSNERHIFDPVVSVSGSAPVTSYG